MKLTPAESRLVVTALRYYQSSNVTTGHSVTDLISAFVKLGDGGDVSAALTDEAGEAYHKYVLSKASKQTTLGKGLPPGVELSPEWALRFTGILGSIGELGELCDHIKKHIFHGHEAHPLDQEYIKLEQGDRGWYDEVLDESFGLVRHNVRQANIAKLDARYQKGRMTAEESANRVEGHPEEIHQPTIADVPKRLASQCEVPVLRDAHNTAGGYVRCVLPNLHSGQHQPRLGYYQS